MYITIILGLIISIVIPIFTVEYIEKAATIFREKGSAWLKKILGKNRRSEEADLAGSIGMSKSTTFNGKIDKTEMKYTGQDFGRVDSQKKANEDKSKEEEGFYFTEAEKDLFDKIQKDQINIAYREISYDYENVEKFESPEEDDKSFFEFQH